MHKQEYHDNKIYRLKTSAISGIVAAIFISVLLFIFFFVTPKGYSVPRFQFSSSEGGIILCILILFPIIVSGIIFVWYIFERGKLKNSSNGPVKDFVYRRKGTRH